MNTAFRFTDSRRAQFTLVVAIAIGATAGCQSRSEPAGGPPSAAVATPPPPPTPAAPAPEHVNLTGCLQQGNHGVYILTALNEPARPDSSKPAVVAREKLAAAENAYRLSSDDDQKFKRLIGRRVRVEGILTKSSDLMAGNVNKDRAAATTGKSDEIKSLETGDVINQSDLARVDVRSIERVASSCGSRAPAKRGTRRRS